MNQWTRKSLIRTRLLIWPPCGVNWGTGPGKWESDLSICWICSFVIDVATPNLEGLRAHSTFLKGLFLCQDKDVTCRGGVTVRGSCSYLSYNTPLRGGRKLLDLKIMWPTWNIWLFYSSFQSSASHPMPLELLGHLKTQLLPFFRCSALFFHFLTEIPGPALLKGKRYLGLASSE